MMLNKSKSLSFYCLLALLVLCPGFLRGVLFAKEKVAALKAVKGTVEVQRGGSGSWDAASDGMSLFAQDTVRTKLSSECQIAFVDGHNIKMTALATVQIKAPRKPTKKEDPNSNPTSDVKVNVGKIFAKVKKSTGGQYEISTPTAVAGIRGTALSLGVDESGATTCSVMEGAVGMSNDAGKEVAVGAGQEVKADASGELPDEASPMSEEEKASWAEQKDWVEQVEAEVEGKLEGEEGIGKEGMEAADMFESFAGDDAFALFDDYAAGLLSELLSDSSFVDLLDSFNEGENPFQALEDALDVLSEVEADTSFSDVTIQDDTISLP